MTIYTVFSVNSIGAILPGSAIGTGIAFFALDTLNALLALVTLVALFTLDTLNALLTLVTFFALDTLNALLTLVTFFALDTLNALLALVTLVAFFALGTCRSHFSGSFHIERWASYWPEVLAVFAVHTNLNADSDVVVINAAQKQRIQDAFWAMHEITYEVEEVDTTPEPTEDDPDPEQQTEYILHITVNSKTVDELAELYNFTQDQKDILHELLSDEMRPTLLALCGGIGIIEDGELCWPLPGHTYISCNFGDDDAYGNSGHRGTDIPAPEGTPILAAHSGTVIISGWNNSYGNQVLLDNGAGLSTRYAHMTQTAVAAGEAVTAGQVIGYVGNTGDSTGFHLHFEVMQNGVRVNPLDAVTPQ